MDHVILVLVQTTCIMWSAKSDSTERAVDRRRWFIRRNSHEPNINSSNVVYQNDVFPRCSLKIKIGVDRRLNRFGSCEIQPLNRASFPPKRSFPRDTWPWPKFTWQSCSCSTRLLLLVNTCYPFLYSSIGLRCDTSMHDKKNKNGLHGQSLGLYSLQVKHLFSRLWLNNFSFPKTISTF